MSKTETGAEIHSTPSSRRPTLVIQYQHRLYDIAHILFQCSNALLCLNGIAIFVCGLTFLARFVQFKQEYPPIKAEYLVFVISMLGGFTCCLTCIGAVAALLRQDCLMGGYVIGLLPSSALQVYFAIEYSHSWNELRDLLRGIVRSKWDDRFTAQSFWDDTQQYWKCCGLQSSMDWIDVGMLMPASCCDPLKYDCDQQHAYQTGCETEFVNFVRYAVWMMTMSYLALCMKVFCHAMLIVMKFSDN